MITHYVALCDYTLGPLAAVGGLTRLDRRYKIVKLLRDEYYSNCDIVETEFTGKYILYFRKEENSLPQFTVIVLRGTRQALWRTPWSVYYGPTQEWIPIVDMSSTEGLCGEYLYGLRGDSEAKFLKRVAEQIELRSRMIPAARPIVNQPQKIKLVQPSTIVPTFIASSIKRDAVTQKKSCPISMDDFTPDMPLILTQCYHLFSKQGLEEWLQTSKDCPICMAEVTSQQLV